MLHRRTCIALLLLLSACATMDTSPGEAEEPSPRFANLQRAAQYPWADDGLCVVREASNEWPLLAERCYSALDHKRVRFRDVTGRCAVASTGAAVAAVGLCVFVAPEIILGAVIVTGVVVVAVAIKEGLEAYERSASRERGKPTTQPRPPSEQEPVANREPTPRGLGRDWFPPDPPVSSDPRERSPECRPIPVPHRGGNVPHNTCADKVPNNSFPGWDVLVNGKHFDALQLATRTLWEIKTDNFDTYPRDLQRFVIEDQVPKMLHERALARACGFDFRVGVRSAAHKAALEAAAPELEGLIEVMDWC